jgi:ATP-dependent Clp protease adapter protein ClpS
VLALLAVANPLPPSRLPATVGEIISARQSEQSSACVLFVGVVHPFCWQGPAGRFSPGALGPEGRAGPVGRAGCCGVKGPASALLPTSPPPSQAAKSIRRLVLDAINLTRWSFCFEGRTHLAGRRRHYRRWPVPDLVPGQLDSMLQGPRRTDFASASAAVWRRNSAGTTDDEALMPTFSRSLEQSLHRALALASEGRHKYAALEHLLLALIDDPDATTVMRACNVDRDKLRRDLVAYIEAKFATDGSEGSTPTAGFQRVIQRAVIHVQSTGREEVTGTHVLVSIVAERESQAVALMQEQGMTRYDMTRYISHRIAKGDVVSYGGERRDDPGQHILSDKPSGLLAEVLLLNDDYTPMEFVVHVLERVYKDRETARRIMLETHNKGTGTCGIYPYDAADAKVREVLEFAREHQHPLQCVRMPYQIRSIVSAAAAPTPLTIN